MVQIEQWMGGSTTWSVAVVNVAPASCHHSTTEMDGKNLLQQSVSVFDVQFYAALKLRVEVKSLTKHTVINLNLERPMCHLPAPI